MKYKESLLLFALFFPNVIFAETISLYQDVSSSEFLLSLIIVIFAASVGGAARTSIMLKKPSFDKKGESLYFFIADQIGAIVAGVIVFLVAEHYEVSSFLEIVVIILAGYMGSILLDALQNGFLEWIKNKFGTNKE